MRKRVLLVMAAWVSCVYGQATRPATAFPASRPGTGPSFDMSAWLKAASSIDGRAWLQRHPAPYSNWFDPESDECARNFSISWGPLGIRTLMHDHTWSALPAFRRAWPKALLDAKGELMFDCFEVLDVNPGSPADGHLQKGDLLVAMDGEVFRTALALRPQAPKLHHQEARALEMDAGEKLDRAEGRGHVSFDVLRISESVAPAPPIANDAQVTDELRAGGKLEAELDVPVSAGQELTTWFEITRDHHHGCAVEVIRPRLEGPAGTLDLSQLRRIQETCGWRKVSVGKNSDGKPITYKGKPEPASIWNHAPGSLAWVVPAGYTRFRATVVANASAKGLKARVQARTLPKTLPPDLAKNHRVVSFPIPKLGSYGRGFPNHGDAKTALVAKMTAAWLVSQQQADGSWKRNGGGFTHLGFDTAWAALGLLAQDDPAHKEAIQKAAYFLAFKSPQDDWCVPASMMVTFLSEYYLRTKDNSILIALQTQIDRLQAEMVYGDFNSGHGFFPGYRGTGVSIGGSHLCLALAVASLAPVRVEPGLVDRMLARAQQLAPDGFIPYGRSTSTRKFESNLEAGGSYSGRHGPYLVASLIQGGPRLFTKNAMAMYSEGAVGGMDQGHASQSLSTTWGLIAAANVSPQAIERHAEALRWKLTMLRSFDGGFGWNAYRLELQLTESSFPNILRSGAYLVALNSSKRNLAITGAPAYRAKRFTDVPAVCHEDAAALGYYQRNWGIADAVLGDRSTPRLKAGLQRLLAMGKGSETRKELFDFLKKEAAPAAREILAIKDFDNEYRHYCAEMVLGVDIRMTVDAERKNNQDVAGMWNVQADVQHPLAGYFEGATGEEKTAWRQNPPLPMEGSIEVVDAGGKLFQNSRFKFDKDCGGGGWHTRELKNPFASNAAGPIDLTARIRYKVADLEFAYDRTLVGGGDEPGGSEKLRKVNNDRVMWVKGRLTRDLNAWNSSFILPSGQYISAATQACVVRVSSGDESWLAPGQGTLPEGTECEFGFTSGWYSYEGRIAGIRVRSMPLAAPVATLTANGSALPRDLLMNYGRGSGRKVDFPAEGDKPLSLNVELREALTLRALDLRMDAENGKPIDAKFSGGLRMTVEAFVNNSWQLIYQGLPGSCTTVFQPVKTKTLRVNFTRYGDKPSNSIELKELRVIAAAS